MCQVLGEGEGRHGVTWESGILQLGDPGGWGVPDRNREHKTRKNRPRLLASPSRRAKFGKKTAVPCSTLTPACKSHVTTIHPAVPSANPFWASTRKLISLAAQPDLDIQPAPPSPAQGWGQRPEGPQLWTGMKRVRPSTRLSLDSSTCAWLH